MNKNVTVLGSFVVDLMARSNHIPLPGETVKGSYFHMGAGGKGSNQAVAAFRSGCKLNLITKLGNDVFSSVALDFYKREGIDIKNVIIDKQGTQTGIALITVEDETSQNSIVVVPGACGEISEKEIQERADVIDSTDILLCQLETNLDILPKVCKIVHSHGGYTVLNTAPAPIQPLSKEFYKQWDILIPNETEASTITGIEIKDVYSAKKAAEVFISWGIKNVIITLGKLGAILVTQNFTKLYPTMDVKVVDTTGAGDAFVGGFVSTLANEKSLEESMIWATAVAALAVTKIGTAPAMPFKAEVENFIEQIGIDNYLNKVKYL
jgi:ribokinase